jgi:hypothetical protein
MLNMIQQEMLLLLAWIRGRMVTDDRRVNGDGAL